MRAEWLFQIQLLKCHHIQEHVSVHSDTQWLHLHAPKYALNIQPIQAEVFCLLVGPCIFFYTIFNIDWNSLVHIQETSTSCLGYSDTIWDPDAWKHVILFIAGFHSLGIFSVVIASSPSWLNN